MITTSEYYLENDANRNVIGQLIVLQIIAMLFVDDVRLAFAVLAGA